MCGGSMCQVLSPGSPTANAFAAWSTKISGGAIGLMKGGQPGWHALQLWWGLGPSTQHGIQPRPQCQPQTALLTKKGASPNAKQIDTKALPELGARYQCAFSSAGGNGRYASASAGPR